jgi:hypothetical protein
MAALGRSIHVRGKGCAHDTSPLLKVWSPLSAWADAGSR